MIKNFIVVLALLLVMASPSKAAGFLADSLFLPPQANYQEFKTKYFKLIYPQKIEYEAFKAADYLEEAHELLSKKFNYEANHLVTIILADNNDLANGVTSALGLQGIVLYTTAPDPYSSIGQYDNWLRNLIIHEYTHYLTLEQTNGFFKFARYLFGDLLFPNHAWPTWLAEGFAVYAESNFSSQGRGHGVYYQTLTRDALFRNTLGRSAFAEYSKLSGSYPDFPFGEAFYYAGYAMIDQLAKRLGEKALADYASESAWRVPFFLNGTLENIGGQELQGFQGLYRDWIEQEKAKMQSSLLQHRTQEPLLQQTLLIESANPARSAAAGTRLASNQEWLSYTIQSGHEAMGLYLFNLKTQDQVKIEESIITPGMAFNADSSKLFYSKIDYDGPLALGGDIYSYDIKLKKYQRLTHSARAKDVDWCRDEFLVFSSQQGLYSELKKLDLANQQITTIYSAPAEFHIANPRCDEMGTTVYFSVHGKDPTDQIYSYQLATKELNYIVDGLFPQPEKLSPTNSKPTLFFTRVDHDYYQLQQIDLASKQILFKAQGVGGFWLPCLTSDYISYSYLTSQGIAAQVARRQDFFKLFQGNANPKLAVSKPLLPLAPEQVSTQSAIAKNSYSYHFYRSLLPRIWFPYLTFSSDRTQAGMSFFGWDDLDQIEYSIYAYYDSIPKKAEGVLSSQHRLGTFKLGFSASSEVNDYLATPRVFDEERLLSLKLQRPFLTIYEKLQPGIILEWARTYRQGEWGNFVFTPNGRLGLELVYDSRQRFGYSVAAEKGALVLVEGRKFLAFGGAASGVSNDQALKLHSKFEYLAPLWVEHAALDMTLHLNYSSRRMGLVPESVVRIGGRGSAADLDPPLRGYPLANFISDRSAVAQIEVRAPLSQIYRGFDHWPVFVRNIGYFAFTDLAKIKNLYNNSYSNLTASLGGGFLLNSMLAYNYPLQFRLELAHGFDKNRGGENSANLLVQF